MGATKKIVVSFMLLVYFEKTVFAKTKVQLVNNFMYQKGHGGKQVTDGSGDQSLTIYEPILYIDSQVGKNTNIFGGALVDLWSSASEAIFDSSTGASAGASATPERHIQKRIGFNFGVSQEMGTWTLTPRMGYSNEFDYKSYNGGINIAKSFAQDNFTVSLGYSIYIDSTHPFDVAASQFTAWRSKNTHTLDLSATQILSPSDIILVGYSFTDQTGFLSGTQGSVDINGTRVSEVLPALRLRQAATLRYIHAFTDSLATHFDYRFYLDNWGMQAHTFEPSLYLSFAEDAGFVKFFYRFYLQNAAKYYQDNFSAAQQYMTSDSDLAKFNSNEGGAMVAYNWDLKKSFIKSINVNGTGLHYRRSNDLQGTIFQLGIGGSF
ncbi:MAG: hypothetical protein ACD_73C00709G0002 [uncultured bacterium]|nr:MAG: hypothetical protein ACD_73C00709G0002 [uncultured bacterium]